MRLLRVLRLWVRTLLHRTRVENELEEEIAWHLSRQIESNVEAGMEPDVARERAVRAFGPVAVNKEECRDVRSVNSLENLLQDLRYGARMLLRNPGFAAVAVLTLALGIGANTAIFSAIDAVLLHPLPWNDPGRLVQVWETHPTTHHLQASYPDYMDWRRETKAFEQTAAYSAEGLNRWTLAAGADPLEVQVSMVSGNLLPMLGVQPFIGRNFDAVEMRQGRDNVALISHLLWVSQFGAQPQAVGRQIALNGTSFQVIGVLPVTGQMPAWADVLVPITRLGDFDLTNRKHHPLEVIARLRPGKDLRAAQSEVAGISTQLQRAFPVTNNTLGAEVVPLLEQMTGDVRRPLLVALAAVGLVLLIACANVANLLLARAAARRKEVAVRIALGAARGRLIRQFLTESVLLSILGAILGLGALAIATPLLRAWAAGFLPRAQGIGIDRNLLVFTSVLTIASGVIFGMFPAWQITRRDQASTLRTDGRGSTGSLRSGLRAWIASAEIALAVVVLISAGVLTRSFARLLSVAPGFRSDGLLTFRVLLPASQYRQYPQIQAFYRRLTAALRSMPGVSGAEVTSVLPLTTVTSRTRFAAEARLRRTQVVFRWRSSV